MEILFVIWKDNLKKDMIKSFKGLKKLEENYIKSNDLPKADKSDMASMMDEIEDFIRKKQGAIRKMCLYKPWYLARVEVIKPVKGDRMVWAIHTCTRINKYMRNTEDQFKHIEDRLEAPVHMSE